MNTPNPSMLRSVAFDGINFLMADVRDGVGPYLSVFLKGQEHWEAGAIGIAMAASSIAAAACQIPAGLLVDSLKIKRLLVAGSGLLVGVGCLLIAFFPQFLVVVAAQAMLGAASAVIPPVIAALSLGLVGHKKLTLGSAATRALTTAAISSPPASPEASGSISAISGSSTLSAFSRLRAPPW